MRTFILFFGLISFTGCTTTTLSINTQSQNNNPIEIEQGLQYPDWTAIKVDSNKDSNIKQFEYTSNFGTELFTIVRFKPEDTALKIAVDSTQPKTVAEWQQHLQAKVVINGSYFDENYKLTTRTVVNNKDHGPLLSGATGTAATSDNLTWQIVDTSELSEQDYLYSIQSYPLLIKNTQAQVDSSAADYAQRTVLAQDDTYTYFIITEYGVLPLEDLDNAIVELIHPTTALNLDGGTSTGIEIVTDDISYSNSSVTVPAVLYIE